MERKEGTLVAIDEIGGHTELLQLGKGLLVGRRKQIGRIGHERIEQTHAHREDGGHTEGDFAAARAENLFGMANHFGQGEHRQDGHGELCDHQGRRNGAELGVHGQHVDEEVGGCHEVVSPGEEEREQGGCGERPLERAAHQTEAEYEEEADDGTHIDGTYGERLVTPILDDARHVARAGGLLQLRGVLIELVVAFQLFYAFAVENAARSAAFEVGHQERERLVDPVAPLGDVVARQSVGALCRGSIGGFGLFGRGRGEFGLAAHRLFRVLPRVVEIRQVDRRRQEATHHEGAGGFRPAAEGFAAQGLNAVGHCHEEHDKQEVVSHLQVVGCNLQGGKKRRDGRAPQVFAAIGQHQAGDGGRNEAEGVHLPEVSGGDDDEKITRKRPCRRAESREQRFETQGAHQQVEAEEIEEEEAERAGGAKAHDGLDHAHHFRRTVGRRNLISGHTREDTVRPTGAFARGLMISGLFLSLSHAGHGVVAAQHEAFADGRGKIGETYQQKTQHNHEVGP